MNDICVRRRRRLAPVVAAYRWRHQHSRPHRLILAAADRGRWPADRSCDRATSFRAPVTRAPCTKVVLPTGRSLHLLGRFPGRTAPGPSLSSGPSDRAREVGDTGRRWPRIVGSAKQVRCRLAICVPGPHQATARSTLPPPPPPPIC